jgi:signal transduction histidine kinase/ActR/RegA family two-component response regulator
MTEPATAADAERVLVIAPTRKDAEQTRLILDDVGLACHACNGIREATDELKLGAGAILVTDEIMADRELESLLEALGAQPAWSDIPLVVLSGAGADSRAARGAMELLGNVTVLERPVRASTLISSLRTAIRARRRQYQIRDQLTELRQAEAQLRDVDRRKDEFLAMLAHELRNPLAPMRNALQLLRLKGSDPAALDQLREMMERQLSQMVRLIDDLLDVSRITRGKLALRKERVELSAVIRDAVETARPHIDAWGHELDVHLPQDPVYLDADPVRLAQVLSNLLNNAAKYTERGGRISVFAEQRNGTVDLAVRDTGIGIPPESLTSIFEMFAQVQGSLERSHGGLGIGLTLVKRLVDMHGGRVEARSGGAGKGAEFVVHLPVARTPQRSNDLHEEGQQPVALRCRILVADDNGDAAEMMSSLLRCLGHEVRTVRDGAQAVEEAEAFRPDLTLLDIGMPRMDGYEAARRIRQEQWGRQMILVAVSGWGQDEDKRRATEAGFDRHLTKPVEFAELDKIIAAASGETELARRPTPNQI